jgi:hypothetical protein
MERLRKDPGRYFKELDVEIFSEEMRPDLNIMEDNQIIDKIVEKTMKEIQEICDEENQKTKLTSGKKRVKRLAREIGHVDRRFLPTYIHDILLIVGEDYKRRNSSDD